MSTNQNKQIYSFWIGIDTLEKLKKLSEYMTSKGNRVTVSKLINYSISRFVINEQQTIENMERLLDEVNSCKYEEE